MVFAPQHYKKKTVISQSSILKQDDPNLETIEAPSQEIMSIVENLDNLNIDHASFTRHASSPVIQFPKDVYPEAKEVSITQVVNELMPSAANSR